MAGANPEQLKAIERHGGALLSAGAGSGKTFVLTEHLIYLTKQWIEQWSPQSDEDFSRYIKSKFTKVVLMTFTKKAAGEIGIRIFQKFEKALEDNPEQALLWQSAIEALDSLTISTIHGYCYKLIKQGFFADINPGDEIIGEGEFGKQIEDIFNAWLDNELENETPFLKMVLKERRAVLSALKSIISDPTLRLMWKRMDTDSYSLKDTDAVIEELLLAQSFNALFDWDGDVTRWSEFEGKDWFVYLQRVSTFLRTFNKSLSSLNAFALELADNGFKIPRKPGAKAVPQEAKDVYELAKALKDFLKANYDDLAAFEEEGSQLVKGWYGNFRALFDKIEADYAAAAGFTFGDLEYIVNERLDDPSVREMVAKEYNYIIVDEFQDTSYIQFSILSKIVGSDYDKVFCVGDIKQAIYGFRGGELGVFLEMEKKTPLNLNLTNNYRSDQNIIKFNNALFEHLFKLGLGFEGRDHFAVEVVPQTIPLPERARGRIFEIEADVSFLDGKVDKLSASDVEYVEALALAGEIKRGIEAEGTTAILYRKLKPSKILMQLLLEQDIGFTSQVKVPMLEDPILGMFHLLAKDEFDQGKLREQYLEFALNSYLKLLGIQISQEERSVDVLAKAQEFQLNYGYYGIYQAFLIFLGAVGISVSNYQQSLESIKLLIDMGEGQLAKVVRKLEEWSELSYSIDFQYGKDPHKVIIMSAHASKGLEFSKVLLGGIYTNDSSMPVKDMFGKTPYSFKWSKGHGEKTKLKSPHYMLEQALQKRKEFSESKRLFYVACTRAENELGWARLHLGPVKAATVKGSWIFGIDSFLESSTDASEFVNLLERDKVIADLSKSFDASFLERMSNQPPMFHFDNLGVELRLDTASPFLMPELSVTRLAQVSQCPRKFYLNNVLKLEIESGREQRGMDTQVDLEELSSKSFSSASRGIEVHDALSQAIKSDLSISEGMAHEKQVAWAVEKLKAFGEKAVFISERPIKFELFQYMISGIPDLIIQDEQGSCLEIWDFKTGRFKGQAPENYWFQLYAYAYAGFSERTSSEQKPIKLVLCYVDEQKIVDQIVSKEEVENYLWAHCQNLGLPDVVSREHCPNCDFNKICKGKSLSACAPSFSC